MAFGTVSTFRSLHTRCAPGKTGTVFGTFDFVHVTKWKISGTAVTRLARMLIITVSLSNVSKVLVFIYYQPEIIVYASTYIFKHCKNVVNVV